MTSPSTVAPAPSQAPSLLPHLWKSVFASGALSIALGITVVAWPDISVLVAAIFFGAYLLITGIQQVIFAFSLHVAAGGRVLLFISGAAALVLAVLAFRHLYDAVLLLAIWVAVGFIFRGVATTVSAISDTTLPGRVWNILVGLISLVAGVVVLALPFESLQTLALVVGIGLIAIGLTEAVAAFGIRATSRAGSAEPVAVTAPVVTEPSTEVTVDPPTETPATKDS